MSFVKSPTANNDIQIYKINKSIEFLMDLTNLVRCNNITLNKPFSDIFLKQVGIHIEQSTL